MPALSFWPRSSRSLQRAAGDIGGRNRHGTAHSILEFPSPAAPMAATQLDASPMSSIAARASFHRMPS